MARKKKAVEEIAVEEIKEEVAPVVEESKPVDFPKKLAELLIDAKSTIELLVKSLDGSFDQASARRLAQELLTRFGEINK